MNKVYYSQIDNRWSTHPYPSQALPNATIGSGGCGATCGAMVISMLKEIITPDTLGDIFVKDGIRVNGGTSNKAFDSYITEKYGLKCKRKWKLDEAVECLNRGGIVVTRCIVKNGNLFTQSGHFIVLVEYKNNEFLVYDPYLYKNKFSSYNRNNKARIDGTNVYVTYDNMKEYGGYNELWCYEPTGIDTNIDGNITVSYNRGTEGSTNTLANNCKLYSNSNLSGTSYNYLKNTSIKIIENVSANVDKIQVVKTGRVAYVDISNYSKKQTSVYSIMTVVAKSGLNVREKANTNSKIVTAYKKGTRVKIYSISNGWAKGTKGYMYAKYLK